MKIERDNLNWKGGRFFKCLICDKKYWVALRYLKISKYCSNKCRIESQRKKIKVICYHCKKEFELVPTYYKRQRNHYCSWQCYQRSRYKLITNCNFCGKQIKLNKFRGEGFKHHFCDIKCRSNYFIKEKNPAWKGGIANSPYDFNFNNELKKQIKIRDNNQCAICKKTGNLLIHHRDSNKKNSRKENLITLCNHCHGILHTAIPPKFLISKFA